MNNEPTHAEIAEDDNEPANKGAVRRSQVELAGMMTNSLQGVTDDIKELDQRMDRLDRGQQSLECGQASLLKVVNSIDRRATQRVEDNPGQSREAAQGSVSLPLTPEPTP